MNILIQNKSLILRGLFLCVFLCLFTHFSQAQIGGENVTLKTDNAVFRFLGYAQSRYTLSNIEGHDQTNDFEVQRVILMPDVVIKDRLEFFLMVDAASKKSERLMHEYWGQYKFSDAFRIKAGLGKIPFTIESPQAPVFLGNIMGHEGVSYMAGIVGDAVYGNFVGRDFGVSINGHYKKFNYDVGIFQGSGMNQKENNTQKDFAASLTYNLTNHVKLATSVYLGTGHALSDDVTRGIATNDDYSRQRMAFGTELSLPLVYVKSEYLRGWDNKTPMQSFYVEMWTHLLTKQRIDLVFDYEYFDRNLEIGSMTRNYTVGFQWWFHKSCRLASQFQHKHADIITNQWITQFQLVF